MKKPTGTGGKRRGAKRRAGGGAASAGGRAAGAGLRVGSRAPKTERGAQAVEQAGAGESGPRRRWWPGLALAHFPQLQAIFQLGPVPAPVTSNSPEPLGVAMQEVLAEIVASFHTRPHTLARQLGISKEFIRLLAARECHAGPDTIVKLCRAAGCTALEVHVEAHLRCLGVGGSGRP